MDHVKKFIILFSGLFFSLIPAWKVHSQVKKEWFDFDSVYICGLTNCNTDLLVSKKCLDKLESYRNFFSPVQEAKASFLRFRIIFSDENQVKDFEKKSFSAPDTLGHVDALVFSARRYLVKSMPDKAIPLLMEALDSLKANTDKTIFCKINLCEAYREKQEYSKGIAILNEILSEEKSISNENKAFAYNRLAALYNESGNKRINISDSVFKYSELCIALSRKINSKSNLAFSQNELSYQYILKKQFKQALELSQQAVRNFNEAGLHYSAMNALLNQSAIYVGNNDLKSAFKVLNEATKLCKIEDNRNLFMRLYFQMASISNLTGNYKEAFDFLRIAYDLQSIFFIDRINLQINEQSARYELLIKEQKINEEKQKNQYINKQKVILMIAVIILCIALVLSFFYFRSKRREINKQKLIEAVVSTEARERQRIASDLHDGLGPVLSAVNLYFQAYMDAKEADKEAIQIKLQQVISGAIDEVSRISHNISPHILENYGLNLALNNFIAPFTISSRIKVEFSSDLSGRFDLTKELTIYRVITELFNNSLKHSHASTIQLQIKSKGKVIYIFYSDDGKGFEFDAEMNSGMGLYNIRNRVKTFGGRLNVESSQGNGMKVNIEVPV